MKKVNLFLISLVAFVTLSVGLSSCGGGGNSRSSSEPCSGTWVDNTDGFKIVFDEVILDRRGSSTWVYSNGSYKEERWEYTKYDSKNEIYFTNANKTLKFDDSGTTATVYSGGSDGSVFCKLKKE